MRSGARPWLWVVGGVVALAAAIVPPLSGRQDILNLLFLILLYVALGQSWNLLGGFAGQEIGRASCRERV